MVLIPRHPAGALAVAAISLSALTAVPLDQRSIRAAVEAQHALDVAFLGPAQAAPAQRPDTAPDLPRVASLQDLKPRTPDEIERACYWNKVGADVLVPGTRQPIEVLPDRLVLPRVLPAPELAPPERFDLPTLTRHVIAAAAECAASG